MTTPTPSAPTPGAVLDAESVKLLLPGDVLMIDTGMSEHIFVRAKGGLSKLICTTKAGSSLERFYSHFRFTFIRRPGLASPAASPPVAVDGSAKGLVIDGYRAFNAGVGFERLVERPGLDDAKPRPLTDHAEASRQIAELREDNRLLGVGRAELIRRYEAAEADAAKVRGAMPDLSSVIAWLVNGCDVAHAVTELRVYQARIAPHTKRVA